MLFLINEHVLGGGRRIYVAGKCIGASPFNKMLPRCDDVIYKTTVTLVWGQPNSVYLIKMDALNGGARGPGPAASFPGAP